MTENLCRALDALATLKLSGETVAIVIKALAPILLAPPAVVVIDHKLKKPKPKAATKSVPKPDGAVARAVELLRSELAGGAKSATDVESVAERQHISANALGRARKIAGILTTRQHINGRGANVITWALP